VDLLDTAALPGFPDKAAAWKDHIFALRVALTLAAVYERSCVRAPSTHTQTAALDPGATIVRQSGRGRFLIVKGPDRGESVPVQAERPVTFGSGSGNDVVL
jgi:hypothetical protein